ncbi:U32 family peptidase, partial [Pseudomonas aeruginosa]
MQLVCPAGSQPALKSALRQGADAKYLGFRDHNNPPQFAGHKLDQTHLHEGQRRD